MNRRTFLQRHGGLATLAGLAGCLGSSGSDSTPADRDGTQTDGTSSDDSATDSENQFSGIQSDHEEPFQTISVGSRDDISFPDNNRPREIRVWNAAEKARKISLQISRDAEIVVDRSIEFEADAYLAVTLNDPANYRTTVNLAQRDAEDTIFEVSRASFDCNSAGTDVGVMAEGRIKTISMSTAMGCPGPEVADSGPHLSVGQGTCGKQHSASVTFEDEAVRVDGVVRASTPNYDLALAGAGYERETGALTVRVQATEGDDDSMGVQCVGEVPYEATVGFDHGLPREVVVIHESMDDPVEVARVSRGK
jgi:hypothetical protein